MTTEYQISIPGDVHDLVVGHWYMAPPLKSPVLDFETTVKQECARTWPRRDGGARRRAGVGHDGCRPGAAATATTD